MKPGVSTTRQVASAARAVADDTPTTEEVRAAVSRGVGGDWFDRWYAETRRQAWDEGFDAGHYMDNEPHECGCRDNPYSLPSGKGADRG